MNTLEQRLEFINILEELKLVERANMVLGGVRKENSAEHSWHTAMIAMILAPEFPDADLCKVLKMLLIHDTVEIYAGDTFLYSEDVKTQKKRELDALDRLYDKLPDGDRYKELWREFEEGKTKEALFAKAVDLFQPVLNYHKVGILYTDHDPVSTEQVLEKKKKIKDFSPELWEICKKLTEDSKEKGLYR